MSALDRALNRVQRILTLGAGSSPPPPPAPVPAQPERPRTPSTGRRLASVGVAVLLPVVFGVALVPVRSHIGQSISLLMVLPVLVVALLAGRRLATVAALAAAATFGVLHTQPYHRPTIDDPDDIVEMIVLLVIGVTIGYLAESAQQAVVVARVRREELAAITGFIEHIGTPISAEALAERAGVSIASLLEARDCVWWPEYKGTASPVLRPDGTLTERRSGEGTRGGGMLPATIEIPVGHPPNEFGRFIVRTDPRAHVSLEERRAAASVATTLARCITSRT